MSIKEIKAQLENFKTDKEKLDFLERKMKEYKDPSIISFIRQLIAEIKSRQTPSLRNDFESMPLLEQELSRFITEFKPESQQILPIRHSLDSAISSMQVEQKQDAKASYGSDDYGMKSGANYDMAGIQSMDLSSNLASDLRDRFIREGVFSHERDLTMEDRTLVREKLRSMLPGASEEKILTYESSILNNRQPAKIYQKKLI